MPQYRLSILLWIFFLFDPHQNRRAPSAKKIGSIGSVDLPQGSFDFHLIRGDYQQVKMKVIAAAVEDLVGMFRTRPHISEDTRLGPRPFLRIRQLHF
jgi:hypothetical protein